MKTTSLLVLALLAAGCGGEPSSGSAPAGATGTAPSAPAANAPAKAPAQAPAGNNPVDAAKQAAAATQQQLNQAAADLTATAQQALKDVKIPTQDEADAAAAKAITDANADAEFDKLMQEIEGDKP